MADDDRCQFRQATGINHQLATAKKPRGKLICHLAFLSVAQKGKQGGLSLLLVDPVAQYCVRFSAPKKACWICTIGGRTSPARIFSTCRMIC
jgi:hypothetical protein